MSFHSLRNSARVALLVLPLAFTSLTPPVFAEDSISTEARAYFRNGVELLQNSPPNYQDAYYQFKLAYSKSKSWKVLGNLGLCAVNLERDSEALDAYEEYLRRGDKEIAKEEREAIERDILLIRGNGATVELTSTTPDLEVRDVRLGASVAPQVHQLVGGKKSLFVRAGTHEFTASTKSGRRLVWSAVLEPGTQVTHEFDFDAPVDPPASAGGVTPGQGKPDLRLAPSEPRGGVSPLQTVGIITLGAGVAALGVGGVTWILAKDKESDANEQCNKETGICDPKAEDLFDESASLARTTNALLIGGGIASAAGIAFIVFGGPSEASSHASGLRLVPVFGAGTAGVVANGAF